MSIPVFDTKIAVQVGVNAAVVYANIAAMCEKNEADGHNIHEGQAWVYGSIKAMSEWFGYLTPNQIRTAISKLVEAGLIAEGNFNKIAYDQTKCYCALPQVFSENLTNKADSSKGGF